MTSCGWVFLLVVCYPLLLFINPSLFPITQLKPSCNLFTKIFLEGRGFRRKAQCSRERGKREWGWGGETERDRDRNRERDKETQRENFSLPPDVDPVVSNLIRDSHGYAWPLEPRPWEFLICCPVQPVHLPTLGACPLSKPTTSADPCSTPSALICPSVLISFLQEDVHLISFLQEDVHCIQG